MEKTGFTTINDAVEQATNAFKQYAGTPPAVRAAFLNAIALHLEKNRNALIETAATETHLATGRLGSELDRTCWQLRSYGAAMANGNALAIRIDRPAAKSEHAPARKHDLRKWMVPLGPVAVFGASNFPFAYSTAGGDTAAALAAGCTVIEKVHPAHPGTAKLVAASITAALDECHLPAGIFTQLHALSNEQGAALVQHPLVRAVAFTGSFSGGKALYDLAARRPEPIPVFAEMGSVNPVFILQGKMAASGKEIATVLAASITGSAGQFCTKPGLIITQEGNVTVDFIKKLGSKVAAVLPQPMLHEGIARAFQHKRADALDAGGVQVAGVFSCPVGKDESIPTLATVAAQDFLRQPQLSEEVFGPFALVVLCRDAGEMKNVAASLKGQLTCTLWATEEEAFAEMHLIEAMQGLCGRVIFNGVPTGVAVTAAMHHGGPFPATTDSRFTSVGEDGILRFCRPVCYQDWPDALLPPALRNENPWSLERIVNGGRTNGSIPL